MRRKAGQKQYLRFIVGEEKTFHNDPSLSAYRWFMG